MKKDGIALRKWMSSKTSVTKALSGHLKGSEDKGIILLWIDSQIFLDGMNSKHQIRKSFTTHRISPIQSHTKIDSRHNVASKENLDACASRGMPSKHVNHL
ncbi:hypothetical protein NPIL_233461 [Nephila pilipes]|uniref:Uncharacterized protein n=1 Tax=Nephila pilipes TaxID=299642 RepID=A0A8X6TNC7_NEPPI|nr:hypothetical protein NPIL_233461 [Nephila pilipes]